MSADHQYCTFFLAGDYFGLNVLQVQEIVREQPMTCVPLASPVIAGLMNLRGQIVTAMDLRRRLGFPDRDTGEESVNVVVQTRDGAVSLIVDEIGDVLSLSHELFEPPPETMRGSDRELILGAYKLPERLLVILSLERILKVPEESTSQAVSRRVLKSLSSPD
ncbi:MAG: chemotaxis protein CheW [Planctomycetota bacterium]